MKKTSFGILLLLLTSIGIVLADVKSDYRQNYDFSKLKTYSWIKVQVENPLWNDRIKNSVDNQLSKKGWQSIPSGGDASLAAYGATHTQKSTQTIYDGMGGGWGWNGGLGQMGTANTVEQDTPVGTLRLDIFDTKTKQLVWRGNSSDTLSDKTEKNQKKLDNAVKDMFKKFPPESKG